MPNANRLLVNSAGGELSPSMYGRVDLPIYQRATARSQNFVCRPQGSSSYRTGGMFVNYTRQNQKARFIEFQFSDQQAYLIEATDKKFRFYKDNGIITETPKTVEAMTNADPGVFTITAHGLLDGDEIFLDSLYGTTGINSRFYLVTNVTADTFTLTDLFGVVLDTTNVGTYTVQGTIARVYEIDTPYAEEHIDFLQYAQSADTMYITHQEYEPGKLVRMGHANWTLDNSYARTGDFIVDSGDYPRSVCFNDSGRLLMGGTKNHPETIYASKAPSSGNTDYDDFTDGVNPTDGIIFTLAPLHGKVDSIQWLSMTSKFLTAGGFGSIRRIYGAAESEPISPTTITAKSVNTFGCAYALPVSNGENLFYIERTTEKLCSLEYDIQIDGYITTDRNLVAEHITIGGFKQIVEQQGSNLDIVWVTRNDGVLLGLTFKEKEDISGWHQHHIGGQHVADNNATLNRGRVLWAAPMARPDKADQLWTIVERNIPAYGTVRSVEYFEDTPRYPLRDDYYTGEAAITETVRTDSEGNSYTDIRNEDEEKFNNVLFEFNKDSTHLDMAVRYDGSDYGIDSQEIGRVITAITQADPGVVTIVGHGYATGDVVYISGVVGMTELNNQFYEVVVINADTFSLIGNDITFPDKPRKRGKKKKKKKGTQEALNGPVDTTSFTAYTSDGTASRLGVSLVIGAVSGSLITFHATGEVFLDSMVGRQLWKAYDINGDGGGRAVIRQVSSTQDVLVDIIEDFDSDVSIPPGGWLLTADTLSGLEHLIGETIGVVIDGGEHDDRTVDATGSISLISQASIAIVGYRYLGMIKTLNLDVGGVTGPAQGKFRSLIEAGFRFFNSVGTLFGTNPYELQTIDFPRYRSNRPTLPLTGQVHRTYIDSFNENDKAIYIVQDKPLPCTVLSIDAYVETTDE